MAAEFNFHIILFFLVYFVYALLHALMVGMRTTV